MDIKELIGETLKFVDVGSSDEILLTTESGRTIKLFHYQDCCEHVRIQDTEGNWHNLIGKVIIDASHDEGSPDDGEYYESATLTTLVFKTDKDTVISRWIGTSNGYYSESVSIEEISKGF